MLLIYNFKKQTKINYLLVELRNILSNIQKSLHMLHNLELISYTYVFMGDFIG